MRMIKLTSESTMRCLAVNPAHIVSVAPHSAARKSGGCTVLVSAGNSYSVIESMHTVLDIIGMENT